MMLQSLRRFYLTCIFKYSQVTLTMLSYPFQFQTFFLCVGNNDTGQGLVNIIMCLYVSQVENIFLFNQFVYVLYTPFMI